MEDTKRQTSNERPGVSEPKILPHNEARERARDGEASPHPHAIPHQHVVLLLRAQPRSSNLKPSTGKRITPKRVQTASRERRSAPSQGDSLAIPLQPEGPREACGAVHAGARPQVRWPRVSRGGRLVTEVRVVNERRRLGRERAPIANCLEGSHVQCACACAWPWDAALPT